MEPSYKADNPIEFSDVRTADLPDVKMKRKSGRAGEAIPWFYNPEIFLPGKIQAIKIGSTYPLLAIGRFLPVFDFFSDIASAGNCLFFICPWRETVSKKDASVSNSFIIYKPHTQYIILVKIKPSPLATQQTHVLSKRIYTHICMKNY